MTTTTTDCPCGSALPYASCCGRFHAGPLHLLAPTAEALMRSRYSAYTLQLDDYLLATWHPTTRPTTPFHHEPQLRWLGLQVMRHEAQGADAAVVEFVARTKLGGKAHRLRELSRFVREDGRWVYVEAIAP
jgi:SEC-C motif-containing protein